MRKLFIFVSFLLLCGVSFAQQGTYVPMYPHIYGSHENRSQIDSAFHPPVKDTTLNTNSLRPQFFYNSNTKSFWGWSQDKGYFEVSDLYKIDSIAALKLNISDTASMLSPYARRTELQDTAAAIRADFPSGGGSVNSVTGNPSNLVDNTDPANPVIQQDNSKLDKSDSTLANRITNNTTAIAGKQDALVSGTNIKTINGSSVLGSGDLTVSAGSITGLITAGANVTVSGSGTSGSPYNISSTGGGTSSTITVQKSYYHGEMYRNHGIDSTTGLFTVNNSRDITDFLPIEGSTSITIKSSNSSLITVYGWTYDSSFTPISEIRSNTLIGTKASSYTFTTPSNARYYCIYTKAANDSFSLRLMVNSTSTVTTSTIITPETYSGNDRQKIQQALLAQRFLPGTEVECKGPYSIDSTLILCSGNTLVLNNATLKTASTSSQATILTNEVSNGNFFRGNREIKILGYGNAIIQGIGLGGNHTLLFQGMANFEISGIKFKSTNLFATAFFKCRYGTIHNITFSDGLESANQDGLHFLYGSHDINIYDIRGITGDDMIALNNYTAEHPTIKTIEPYLGADSSNIFNLNFSDIARDRTTQISGTGPNIRFYADNGYKIHDIKMDGVTGDANINFTSDLPADIYNIHLSNIHSPIKMASAISNSSFTDIIKYDTTGAQTCIFTSGTSKVFRRYFGDNISYVDTVTTGGEHYAYGLLGANPTATVGLTAVNGSATTYMRSDAAPAINQAIIPTWTGTHTFTNATAIVNNVNNTAGLNARFGTFGIQSNAVNNAWSSDNAYYNGSRFVALATGYAVIAQFFNGGYMIQTAPSVGGGSNLSATVKFQVYNGGDVVVGSGSDAGYKFQVGGTTKLDNTVTLGTAPTTNTEATPKVLVRNATSGNVEQRGDVPIITSGTAAPTTTPAKVGDIYVDTTNKKLYFAAGASSSADWIIAN